MSDRPVVQDKIRLLLETAKDMEVVCEAATEDETVRQVRSTKPDIVVMDIGTLLMNSLQATGRIQLERPGTKVLVISDYESRDHVLLFIKAGASGLIEEATVPVELTISIRSICHGDSYLSPVAARVLVQDYWQVKRRKALRKDPVLTFQQLEVLKLLAQGCTTKEIATILTVTRRTAKTCITSLLNEFGIHSRASLVKYATREGLLIIS